ncbi:MAG: hypothetical protein ACRD3W_23600, partial [Terriglobales bacterium]
IQYFGDATTPVRIAVTILLLFPVGCVLGTLFPIGMTVANERHRFLTPWLWGINGAGSVLGSVLTILASMWVGITASLVIGLACYVVALAVWIKRRSLVN